MKTHLAFIGILSLVLVTTLLLLWQGFSLAEKKTMPDDPKLEDNVEPMDAIVTRTSAMMEDVNAMSTGKMPGACMGMMDMKGMGMTMYDMSNSLNRMMDAMDSMMANKELMKDATMKANTGQMHQQLLMMGQNMKNAMQNMQEMTKRMDQMAK